MTTGARIFVAGAIALAVAAVVIAIQHARLVDAGQRVDDLARDVRDRTAERDAARRDVKVVTQYVDRVQVVRGKGDTIIKEIPVYVDREADRACVVPVGFVRVHDGAAANVPVGDPGSADAAPSGIALSAVAATVAGNYTTCHENAEQLIALQTRVRDTEEPAP
ncbi:signal peptide protein [Burkholderia pseudomallei]|nr:signal peptide protein [Burkholderia pseudomallei]